MTELQGQEVYIMRVVIDYDTHQFNVELDEFGFRSEYSLASLREHEVRLILDPAFEILLFELLLAVKNYANG